MFTYSTQIYLHHTDAAGRLFFARQFDLVHEAKEHYLESLGLPLQMMLSHPEITFPLVHAEAEYRSVLVSGDRIQIQAKIEKLGETSVVFSFILLKQDGITAGTARTVNVCVNKKSGLKCPIPAEWRHRLIRTES